MEPSPVPLHSLLNPVDPVRNISEYLSASAAVNVWSNPSECLTLSCISLLISLSLSLCPTVLSQQMMILEMFIITLVNRFLYRRTYDTLHSEAHDNDQNSKVNLEAALVEQDV